jgi:RNA polymerase-binding transcription factor DksA
MKKELLVHFAELLRAERARYLREFRRGEDDLDIMGEERESELEEHAQEEQAALFLVRHDQKTLEAVRDIDAALQRILDGNYGRCEGCHRAISGQRLAAVPAARLCKGCTERSGEARNPAESVEFPAAAPIPGDLLLLDDREISASIAEHLREDGRVDTEELHIVCRNGVVYLSGKIPSEAEHKILLHTITDVLGLTEVVDRIEVESLLWQTESRAKEPVPEITRRWKDPVGTEDIVQSHEEGEPFVAPAKPTPDE